MSRTGQIFIAILWSAGLITGLVLARYPQLPDLPTLAFSILLAAGLVVDLAIRPRSQDGRMPPLTMPARGAGVIGGALIAMGTQALLGTS